MPELSRDGEWTLQQWSEPDAWTSGDGWSTTMIGRRYVHKHEAQAQVDRFNEIQPGRWRLKHQPPVTG